MVVRTRLSVTLDVHCMFCSLSLSLSLPLPFYHNHPCFLCFIAYFHCPACSTYDPGPLHSATPIFLFCSILKIFRADYTYSTLNMTMSRSSAKAGNLRFPCHKPDAAFSTQDGIRGRLPYVHFLKLETANSSETVVPI